MRIRREQPADVDAIFAVHAASFPTPAEARLVDLLRDAEHLSISLVAEIDSQVVGHVAFSPVTAASGAIGTGLGPIAVVEPHRRRGIAAELVREGLRMSKEVGIGWAVVLGDPKYYSRFGFQPASTFALSDEYGGGDAFQVIELIANQLPRGGGSVRYTPEFASLESA